MLSQTISQLQLSFARIAEIAKDTKEEFYPLTKIGLGVDEVEETLAEIEEIISRIRETNQRYEKEAEIEDYLYCSDPNY